jgi:hypothetical protein
VLDITSARIQIDYLKNQLLAAWSETPFPVDKVAALNKQLKETLASSGLRPPASTTDRRGRAMMAPETREKIRAGAKARWERWRAAKALKAAREARAET